MRIVHFPRGPRSASPVSSLRAYPGDPGTGPGRVRGVSLVASGTSKGGVGLSSHRPRRGAGPRLQVPWMDRTG